MATAQTKPAATVFYSWQSDLPNATNRGFIEDCLDRAIKELDRADQLKVDVRVDRDTKGARGAADIADEIYQKIDACNVFVADVSFINKGAKIGDTPDRPTPNPNVLLELGYAANNLTWNGVIPVLNLDSGRVEDLPFDLRKRRVVTYSLPAGAEASIRNEQRKSLTASFKRELPDLLKEIEAPVQIEVYFFDREADSVIGNRLELSTTIVEGVDRDSLPDYDPDAGRRIVMGSSVINLPSAYAFSPHKPNRNFYRDYFDATHSGVGTIPIAIAIRNSGPMYLSSVKMMLNVDPASIILKDADSVETHRVNSPMMHVAGLHKASPGDVEVSSKRLAIEFGNLRRGEETKSEDFRIGTMKSGTHVLQLQIYSEQHAPQHYELTLQSEVSTVQLTNEEFLERIEELENDGSEGDDDSGDAED